MCMGGRVANGPACHAGLPSGANAGGSNPSPCTRIDTIAKGDLNFDDSVKPMGLPESTAIRLRTQLDCLPTILAGISEGALDRRPLSENGSSRENLAC